MTSQLDIHDRLVLNLGQEEFRKAAVEAVSKHMTIRFTVPEETPGGLALYGKEFGRYPLDPTLVFSY